MKTFAEFIFIIEDAEGANEAWRKWMNDNPQEFKRGGKFYEKSASDKVNRASREFIKTYMKTGQPPEWGRTSVKPPGAGTPPPPPRPPSGAGRGAGTPPPPPRPPSGAGRGAGTPPPPPRPPSGAGRGAGTPPPPPRPPSGAGRGAGTPPPPPRPPSGAGRGAGTPPPPPRPPSGAGRGAGTPPKSGVNLSSVKSGFTKGIGMVLGPGLTAGTEYIQRRAEGQSKARSLGGGLTAAAAFAAGAKAAAPLPIPNPIAKGATSLALGTAFAAGAKPAYDWAVEKSRPARQAVSKATGYNTFKKIEDLTQKIQKSGASKPAPGMPPKGSPTYSQTRTQAQSTIGMRGAREVASQRGVYGARKGSALVGTSTPTTVNRQARTITSGGRTASLSPTGLIRDPKTGKQTVGDLAFKGGRAVYMARPSIQSRDTSLQARVGRALNLGRYSKEAEANAAKQEYRTALRSTQQRTKQLGITPQAATRQKLPGYGVGSKAGPKKVGPKIVGPRKVGATKPASPSRPLVKPA